MKVLVAIVALLGLAIPVWAENRAMEFGLAESIVFGLEHNLTVAEARTDVEQAQWQLKEADAAFQPHMTATAAPLQWQGPWNKLEYGPESSLDLSWTGPGGTSAALGIRQEVNEEGIVTTPLTLTLSQRLAPGAELTANNVARTSAEIALAQARLALEEAQASLKEDITRSFYHILISGRNLQLARLSQQEAEQHLSITRDEARQGMANELEVLEAEAELLTAEKNVVNAEHTHELSLTQFKDLLNVDAGTPLTLLRESAPAMRVRVQHSLDELLDLALHHNRQLTRQQLAVQHTEWQLLQKEAAYAPAWDFSLGYTYTPATTSGGGLSSASLQSEHEYSAALVVSFSFFDGGEGIASLGQARSRLEADRLDVAQLKQQIQNDVRTLYFDLEATDRHIEVLEAARLNRRQSLEIARRMRAQGALTEIEVLPYEQSLREAQRDLLQAVADYESTRLQLFQIVGQI